MCNCLTATAKSKAQTVYPDWELTRKLWWHHYGQPKGFGKIPISTESPILTGMPSAIQVQSVSPYDPYRSVRSYKVSETPTQRTRKAT